MELLVSVSEFSYLFYYRAMLVFCRVNVLLVLDLFKVKER